MGRPKTGECIYCGKTAQLTKDHVIPKSLFVQPYPANLITVKACEACNNNEKSRDDDYLRDLLATDIVGGEHHAGKDALERMMRSFDAGKSQIMREAMASMRIQPFYTPGGIYLGDFPSYSIDGPRITRIFERIIRGLYYDARKQRIPDGYLIDVRRYYPWDIKKVLDSFQQRHPNGPRILGDIFGCMFLSAEEDPFTTIWLIWFFGSVAFTVSAINPALAEDMQ